MYSTLKQGKNQYFHYIIKKLMKQTKKSKHLLSFCLLISVFKSKHTKHTLKHKHENKSQTKSFKTGLQFEFYIFFNY